MVYRSSVGSFFSGQSLGLLYPTDPNGVGELYRWWQKSKLEAWEKLLRQAFLSDQIDPSASTSLGYLRAGMAHSA